MELYLRILFITTAGILCGDVPTKSESVHVSNVNMIHQVANNYRKSALYRRRNSLDSSVSVNDKLLILEQDKIRKADNDSKSRAVPYFIARNLSKTKETDYFLENNVAMSPFWYQYRAYVAPGWKSEQIGKNSMRRLEETTTTTTPVVRTVEPIVRSIYLDPTDKPFIFFTIDQDNSVYNFELKKDLNRDYFISVVVEKMKCGPQKPDEETMLFIEGDSNETQYQCLDMDNSRDNFQNVEYLKDGDKQVKVKTVGNWTDSNAHVIASIYYESSRCSSCEASNDHFCCGRTSHPCYLESNARNNSNVHSRKYYSTHQTATVNVETRNERFRCIPSQDKSGNSLLCNGHPNCGLSCNLDEQLDYCPKGGDGGHDDNPCPAYTCREESPDRFFITILILILFCLFLPLCIFMFFCSRKDLRREFFSSRTGRPGCAWPFEILLCPFSINVDSNVPPEDTRPPPRNVLSSTQLERRGNVRRQGRRGDEFRPRSRVPIQLPLQTISGQDNFSFFDDLPPSYSECCDDKNKYPNPPKADDVYPSVFQVARTQDQVINEALSATQQQSQPLTPVRWCTCNCVGGGGVGDERDNSNGQREPT